ncbi:unnamed protein product [Prorocentrum cordatum]|uniref:Uncharacterized protein n=1 Tax=Prorocentrum cordatum TaxID=2364126 RepID=A0ABN9V3C1_9DINO|nr:unnamed protein product [Polarella glacialis]
MFDTCGCFSRIAGTSASEKSEQWPMVLALLSEVREAKLELEAQRHQLQRWGQRVRTWRAAAAVAGAAQRDAGREAGAQRHLYYNPDVARARHASRAPAAPDRPDRSAVRRRLPRAPRWLQHGLRQPENVFRCALDGTRTFHMSPNGAPWLTAQDGPTTGQVLPKTDQQDLDDRLPSPIRLSATARMRHPDPCRHTPHTKLDADVPPVAWRRKSSTSWDQGQASSGGESPRCSSTCGRCQ